MDDIVVAVLLGLLMGLILGHWAGWRRERQRVRELVDVFVRSAWREVENVDIGLPLLVGSEVVEAARKVQRLSARTLEILQRHVDLGTHRAKGSLPFKENEGAQQPVP